MKAIDILHAQCSGVASRVDGSLSLKFVTPEMLASAAGVCIGLHGKNVRLTVIPEDVSPEELIRVDTERAVKTPSQRLRSVLYVAHQQGVDVRQGENFANYYDRIVDGFVERVKARLS